MWVFKREISNREVESKIILFSKTSPVGYHMKRLQGKIRQSNEAKNKLNAFFVLKYIILHRHYQVGGNGFCSSVQSVVEYWSSNPEDTGTE